MDDLVNFNSEQAFNNVRNCTWDLDTFQEWLSARESEARNDAIYYNSIANNYFKEA